MTTDRTRLWTVGHGTASRDDFSALLATAGLALVVDVRLAPGSRRHPQFGKDAMSEWLPASGVDYRWEPRLGGRRKPPADSPDSVWRNDSFRGYAAWTRTEDFLDALDGVVADAAARATAVMCSESVWWRCHRRLVADAATLLRGIEVRHLMHDGRTSVHEPTEGVRLRDDGLLVYDAGQATL